MFLAQQLVRALKYNTVFLSTFIVIQFCILHLTVTVLSSEEVDSYFKLQNIADVLVISLHK